MRELSDTGLFKQACYLDGGWLFADETIDVDNPSTGETLGTVPNLCSAQAESAIAAAAVAQPVWAKKTSLERSALLMAWHDLVLKHQKDLARLLTQEQGKSLKEAEGEIAYGASFIKWFAEEARRINGTVIPAAESDKRILVLRQPIGVVAAITPWNFPNAMITRKAAPALAAGCTMVLKPAAETPFSALALAELAQRAGIPNGVFNVITGDSHRIGEVLTADSRVAKLTFTGSTQVGRILMLQSAPTLKKLSLELGGNAPFIVFNDADIDAAVAGAINAKFRNNGQTCVCSNRLYVQSGVYDAFVSKFAKAVKQLRVGDGMDSTDLGPLIGPQAVAKVKDHIEDAVKQGGIVVLGGRPHPAGPNFFEPTVLAGAKASMKVSKEETFGPLAPVFSFETEEEVLKLANDTEFGLASYFFTRDASRVWRMSEALEFGMVGINTGAISTAEAPFGGIKQSGMGREGSTYGIDDYVELKYLCMLVDP